MKADELFEQFAKREHLHTLEVSDVDYTNFPYFTVKFGDSSCCDHETSITVYVDGEVQFSDGFCCNLQNLDILVKALQEKVKEVFGESFSA